MGFAQPINKDPTLGKAPTKKTCVTVLSCYSHYIATNFKRSYMMAKYKLNFSRDVDTDEPGVYILNLPAGFRFAHDVYSIEHVRAYDSIKELRDDIKSYVIPCQCAECQAFINGTTGPGLKNTLG